MNRMHLAGERLGKVVLHGLFALSAALSAPAATNPIITNIFTADPAPVVIGDTVYLILDHDEARGNEMFTMNDWLCYTSQDMQTWTAQGAIMKVTDFKWAVKDAWAPQMIPRNGKFYLYAPVQHDRTHPGMAIGVAVADSPLGPYVDARGTALVTNEMTKGPYSWPNIDPTVFVDEDGTPWLVWGNNLCFIAQLKANMTELAGPIRTICVPNYTEGPWLWKRRGLYYLAYASFAHQGFSESISYATAKSLTGPWTYHGEITGPAENSYTIHPGIVEFKGQSYFFYHNAALTIGDQKGAIGRRAVCMEYLYYNADGTIQPIAQTSAGVSVPPHPAIGSPPAPADRGPTADGVTVTENLADFPRSWPGTPAFATVADPFNQTPQPVCFSHGVSSLGQTFVVAKDLKLARLALYAGDGVGTSPTDTLTLALYDLGPADQSTAQAPAEDYAAGANLLGGSQGLRFAYTPQGPGLMNIDFAPAHQASLRAGHRYALEIQSGKDSRSMCWYGSQYDYGYRDVYVGGAAYHDRKLVKNQQGVTADFGFAIYGAAQ